MEGSTSNQPIEDYHINVMDLNGEHQTFLTQEDQEEHDCNQLQTKTGESFDFKQGYDIAVYELQKQYKLRTRTIDIPQPSKTKDGKQPNKNNSKVVITDFTDTTVPNPNEVTVEDITDMQPSVEQSLPSSFFQRKPKQCPKKLC